MGIFKFPRFGKQASTTTNNNTDTTTNVKTNATGGGIGALGYTTSFLKKNQGTNGIQAINGVNGVKALAGGESSVLGPIIISLVFVFGASGMTSAFVSASW